MGKWYWIIWYKIITRDQHLEFVSIIFGVLKTEHQFWKLFLENYVFKFFPKLSMVGDKVLHQHTWLLFFISCLLLSLYEACIPAGRSLTKQTQTFSHILKHRCACTRIHMDSACMEKGLFIPQCQLMDLKRGCALLSSLKQTTWGGMSFW
jgi:hypothetical protein